MLPGQGTTVGKLFCGETPFLLFIIIKAKHIFRKLGTYKIINLCKLHIKPPHQDSTTKRYLRGGGERWVLQIYVTCFHNFLSCFSHNGPALDGLCLWTALQTPSQSPGILITWLTKWSLASSCSYKSGLFPALPSYKLYCDEIICVTFWFPCVFFPFSRKGSHWVKAIKQSALDKHANMLPIEVALMDASADHPFTRRPPRRIAASTDSYDTLGVCQHDGGNVVLPFFWFMNTPAFAHHEAEGF